MAINEEAVSDAVGHIEVLMRTALAGGGKARLEALATAAAQAHVLAVLAGTGVDVCTPSGANIVRLMQMGAFEVAAAVVADLSNGHED